MSPTRRATLVLAEDHPQLSRDLCALLQDEFDVVGIAADGAALLTLAQRLRPDVVVTDIGMPGMDGIAAATQLVRLLPGLPVVFVSVYVEPEIVQRALAIGRAFVEKAAAGDELTCAVKLVLAGDGFISASIASPKR